MVKKKFFKKKRVWIAIAAVVVLAAGSSVFVMGKVAKKKAASAVTVQEAVVSNGDVSNTIKGTGTIDYADTTDVTVPTGVEVEEIKVESGDSVKKGDTLATLKKTSVSKALVNVQQQIEDIGDELDDSDNLSSLEIEVLKEERSDLRDAEKELKALRTSPKIVASASGIVGSIYVTENAEVSRTTDEASSASGSSTSSSSTSSSSKGTVMGMSYTKSSTADGTVVKTTATKSTMTYADLVANMSTDTDEEQDVETVSEDSIQTFGDGEESGSGEESGEESGGDTTPSDTNIIVGSLGVEAPMTGKEPQRTIECKDDDGNLLYDGNISWDCTGKVFQADTVYTATIVLNAQDGYVFSEDNPPSISNAAYTWSISASGKKMTITAKFEKTTARGGGNNNQSQQNTDNKQQSAQPSAGGSVSGVSGGSASGSSGGSNSIGEYGAYKAVAFTIAEDDEVAVSIDVDEQDILSVEKGQTADITLDAVDGKTFTGTISKVAATASSTSGSSTKYEVNITIPRDEDMRIGMNASASIKIEEASDVLTIPMTALQQKGDTSFVYTENNNGELSGEVTVETGISDGTTVEIKSGLEQGQTVYYIRTSSSDNDFSGFGGGQMPSGGMPSGGMPSGGMPSGDSGNRPSGGMPSGGPGSN